MAQARILGTLGYGLISLLVVTNVEGASEYLSELGRFSVHFLSRSKDRLSSATGLDLGQLNDKLDRLASARSTETVIVHHGSSGSTGSWVTTLVGGTLVTVLIVHFTGLFDMSGVM
jgi:hypothetical protein